MKKSVDKHLQKYNATLMGHMTRQCMNTCSTQPKKELMCDFETLPSIADGLNSNIVYAAMLVEQACSSGRCNGATIRSKKNVMD
jgi:hypothetical protein